MRLTAGQRAAVAVRIEFARAELADADEYANLDWSTYQADAKARRNVERIAENVANATIDIAKILLAGQGASVPETYRAGCHRSCWPRRDQGRIGPGPLGPTPQHSEPPLPGLQVGIGEMVPR